MTHAHLTGDIEVAESGTALVLRIRGELDASSSASVGAAVTAALASAASVILDLGGLTFCDSRGLAMFATAQATARAAGTSLVVRNLGSAVGRLFAIAGSEPSMHADAKPDARRALEFLNFPAGEQTTELLAAPALLGDPRGPR